MSKKCELIFSNETMHLHKCNDGYWLYDNIQRMNLAMRADTERDAFIQALEYYQERLPMVQQAHNSLRGKVRDFVDQFVTENDAIDI